MISSYLNLTWALTCTLVRNFFYRVSVHGEVLQALQVVQNVQGLVFVEDLVVEKAEDLEPDQLLERIDDHDMVAVQPQLLQKHQILQRPA